MLSDSADPRTIQQRAGHTDIRVTFRYAQRRTAADVAASEFLGEHFFGNARHKRAMEPDLPPAVGDGTTPLPGRTLEPESGFEPLTYALRAKDSRSAADGCEPKPQVSSGGGTEADEDE